MLIGKEDLEKLHKPLVNAIALSAMVQKVVNIDCGNGYGELPEIIDMIVEHLKTARQQFENIETAIQKGEPLIN